MTYFIAYHSNMQLLECTSVFIITFSNYNLVRLYNNWIKLKYSIILDHTFTAYFKRLFLTDESLWLGNKQCTLKANRIIY